MIELHRVSKVYAVGPVKVPALCDVSFRIDKGEFVVLAGPSGAGKTTLLRLLYRAEPPSDGEVEVFGQDVGTLRRAQVAALRRSIGVVFQDAKLLPVRTVYGKAPSGPRGPGPPPPATGGGGRGAPRRGAPWCPPRRCCWPTSPPGASTTRWPRRSSRCSGTSGRAARPWSSRPTRRGSPRRCAGGRSRSRPAGSGRTGAERAVFGFLGGGALRGLPRAGRVAVSAILLITLSLAALGGFWLVSANLDRAVGRWRDRVRIIVYLRREPAEAG